VSEGKSNSPRERLLYRALADFSDACDVPALTPSCPFYQQMGDGTPVCGEECKDILGDELSHAATPSSSVTLAGEFAVVRGIRRPRPRRGRTGAQLPFDARQIYLTERDRDISGWGMTALINGLRLQLGWMTLDADEMPSIAKVEEICGELKKRGTDPEQVIRQGLFGHVTSAVVWHIRNTLLTGEDDDLGWMALIRQIKPDDAYRKPDDGGQPDFDSVIHAVSPLLTAWALYADLEDVLEHRVRHTAKELLQFGDDLPERDHDAVWLVDRFTATYLEGWSRRSLQREWRYIHSQRAGLCAPASMRERAVDVNVLAQVLAEVGAEHLEGREQQSNDEASGLIRVEQFYPLAVDALERGDRSEAVSIYRMMRKVRPRDRQVNNNLGFCLLPDEPVEAAELFESAIQTSVPGPLMAMTYLNLALARLRSGDAVRAREALQYGRENDSTEFTGYMWDLAKIADGLWVLAHIHGSLDTYAEQLEDLVEAEGGRSI